MRNYIIKRLLLGVIVLLGVVIITFLITRIVPSDPVGQWVGRTATAEQREKARIELGLDKSILEQFGIFFVDLVQGDLGVSLRTKHAVADDLKMYIPATLELVTYAMILAVVIGIPLGINSARKKDKMLDHFCRIFSISAVSLPTFVVAMLLQLLFYGKLKLLPLGGQLETMTTILYNIPRVTGWTTIDALLAGNGVVFADAIKHLILPCVTIALYPIGLVAKQTRSALLEILGEDYITAARSYGLKERKVMWSYALKNSLGTTITVLAISFAFTLVNTFLIEQIFSWPGIGSYVGQAIMAMDSPAIIGSTLFSAVAYVILNLVADIIIALDPRVRVGKQG